MILDELNIASRKVALQLTDDPEIRWTGWKAEYQGVYGEGELALDKGLVAQWVDYQRNYVINLPGMEQQKFVRGATFDIGTERVYLTDDFAHVESLIRDGFTQLMAHREVAV